MSALPTPPPPGADWALFLDLDGTLAPLRPHPDEVTIDAATRRAIDDAARRLDGAVCIVSGRPLHEVRRLVPAADGLRLVGCHGGEGLEALPVGTDIAASLKAVRVALAPVAAGFDGVWVEDKPSGFAIHYRRFPHAGPTLLREALAAASGVPGLRVIAGHAVVEILPAAVSKGRVLERLLATPPFSGRIPVAVGDDATDEDAFAAARTFGGFGIRVGTRQPTVARYALPDAPSVGRWLRDTRPEDARA